jgi:hypothetical protein
MRLRIVAVAVLALAVAGCGGGTKSNGEADKSADAILRDAIAAADAAESVHVRGAGTSGGASLGLDLHLAAGKGGKGRVSTNGVSFQMVRIGDQAYFSGDARFWNRFGGAAAAQLLQGRWIHASATDGDFAAFAPLTSISKLFHQMLGDHGKLEKGEETEVNGEPAIAITDSEQGGTLYVATTGKPYPLSVSSKKKGRFTFNRWDEPVAVVAPKHAIDLASLTG